MGGSNKERHLGFFFFFVQYFPIIFFFFLLFPIFFILYLYVYSRFHVSRSIFLFIYYFRLIQVILS